MMVMGRITELEVRDLGLMSYQKVLDIQKEAQIRRLKGEIADTIILV